MALNIYGGDTMIVRVVLMLMFVAVNVDATISEGLQTIIHGQDQVKPRTINVLLSHDKPGLILETKGKYRILDPSTGKVFATRFVGKRKFVQPTEDGLRWGEEFPGLHQFTVVPETSQGTILVDGAEYRGNVTVYEVNGKISVVNEVEIDDYITSVLAVQHRTPLNHEALATVVIAERTNALFHSLNPKTKFWALDAEQEGYTGYFVTTFADRIKESVRLTHNMVMSRTAAYEGVVTPFPAFLEQSKKHDRTVLTKLSFDEIKKMAECGEDAAQILGKAFPDTSIQLVY